MLKQMVHIVPLGSKGITVYAEDALYEIFQPNKTRGLETREKEHRIIYGFLVRSDALTAVTM
jgi:hypothetical protein